ncbi:hypothetical protein IJG89_03455 [Candidatus Saccharibacteria bacterium]|nr:hypothetical protein [Candidatus Saccharibacteria bacterium]
MKKLLLSMLTLVLGFSLIAVPVFAASDSNCVSTAILGGGQVCDEGNGNSILGILNTVVNIMTVGVGVLGIIGITIVGIQYLTAGGSEEKTRTAKRRMFEIIIGLVAYVVAYSLLVWLIPDFNYIGADSGSNSSSLSSTQSDSSTNPNQKTPKNAETK